MNNFKEILKQAFIKAIGNRADYDIILSASEWVKKGVLIESDVVDIQTVIDERYKNLEIEEEIDENIE